MSRASLDLAVKNLEFARRYTLQLLEDVQPDDWFRMPMHGTSHLAWQVGHLAMAEYALTMIRIRGKEPSDREFMSNDFFRRFQKGTHPDPDASAYPDVNTIMSTFHRVHERALEELQVYSDEQLNEPLPEPHALFNTKLGSVFFCGNHEMLHAGQIGLLRRMLGKSPVR